MSNRELLERAAKAAGIRLEWDGPPDDWCPMYYEGKTYHAWEPLTDDGDAFRLAVKLKIDLIHDDPKANDAFVMAGSLDHVEDVDGEVSRTAAARRAIVRAAAAMAGDAP